MSENKGKRVDCRKCKFFHVTWNPSFPYACKAHGFKGKNIPSQEVYSASGMTCMYFQPKPTIEKQPTKNKYPDYI